MDEIIKCINNSMGACECVTTQEASVNVFKQLTEGITGVASRMQVGFLPVTQTT